MDETTKLAQQIKEAIVSRSQFYVERHDLPPNLTARTIKVAMLEVARALDEVITARKANPPIQPGIPEYLPRN